MNEAVQVVAQIYTDAIYRIPVQQMLELHQSRATSKKAKVQLTFMGEIVANFGKSGRPQWCSTIHSDIKFTSKIIQNTER